MGFTTGFTGGVTLTLGIAYLTVLAHERNRQNQALALRSQSRVLQSLIEPNPPLPPPRTRAELGREERGSLIETAKDKWNEELEGAIRYVQRTDWDEVRENVEGSIARLLGGGLEKSREGVQSAESAAGPRVQEAVDYTRAKASEAKDRASSAIAGAERAGAEVRDGGSRIATLAREKAEQAKASAKGQLDHAGIKAAEAKDAARVKAERAGADARSGLHDAAESIKHSGGTVDAARGALRDAIGKGIEKGKEIVGKAQEAVGLATEKIESTAQSTGLGLSAEEKALRQRYEKLDGLSKSPEEVLAERYKPIDSRDNTVLRGL